MPSPVPPIVVLARVPGRIPVLDVAIAGGLLVWALLEGLLADGPGSTAARVGFAAGFALPLVVRRRWPLPALLAIALVAVVRGAIDGPPEEGAMPFPALLLASFSAALYARPRRLAFAAVPVPIVAMPLAGFGEPLEFPPLVFLSLSAWTAGFLIRRRAEQLERERAEAPERAREAVAQERARMARELHDLVAHSVTVISVQSGAAEGLLERDPGAARGHLDAARRAAHDAMVELRRLVGLLRADDASYSPQPGLDHLRRLADEAGLPVELMEEGDRGPVPEGLSLTAYRIVQEGLTNVRRHAGGAPTRVRVRYGADRLELEVVNAPGRRDRSLGPGSGRGLIGMRERVRLYGGTLAAGRTPEGGFSVRAELPLDAPARAAAEPEPAAVRVARPGESISRLDAVLAAGLLTWGLVETLLLVEVDATLPGVVMTAGFALAVLVRRRWPVTALVAAAAMLMVRSLTYEGAEDETMPFVALLVLGFTAALHARSRWWALAALPLVVAAVVVGVLAGDRAAPPAVDIAILAGIATGAWTAGLVARRRAEQLALAQAQTPELQREAVAAERERVAHELHDIVAHNVSTVSVQAGAAAQLLERDPAAAREHVRAVQAAARAALGEMRRLLGVLRDESVEYTPQPGLSRLSALVEEARRTGHPVELHEHGERGEIAHGLDLAAFRIVQEALDDVRAHAGPAPTVIRVRYGNAIELSLESAANGDPESAGLAGIRERVRVYGGSIEAGPRGDRYVVTARLPR